MTYRHVVKTCQFRNSIKPRPERSRLSCEGPADVLEVFSDESYLSAILDRQGLLVAAPIDLRTKKAQKSTPQLLQGFWHKLKKKNPKISGMSPTLAAKSYKQQEIIWQQHCLCLVVGTPNRWRKTLPCFGPGTGRICWKKVQ